MWHVDEGTLNAYLDGELEARGAGSGERGAETVGEVEAHLAGCAECRALLERVKRVRDRAGEILASSSPADVVAPPFTEIRARAEARSSGSRALRLVRIRRLAWAATVVLAIAVGWYARGTVFPTRSEQVGAPQAAYDVGQEAQMREQTAESGERGAAVGRRETEEGAPAAVAAEPDRAVELADRDAAGGAAVAETGAAAATPPAEVVAAAPSRAQAEAEEPRAQEIADVSRERKGRLDTADRLAAQAPQTVVQQVAAGERAVPLGGVALGEASVFEDSLWVEVSDDEVRDALGGDVPVVQDLPIMDYWVSPVLGRGVVRVRQRLDDENVLELIVSPLVGDVRAGLVAHGIVAAPVANEAQAAAKDSLEAVAIRRGDFRVVLRGPVSVDSLRVLGEKIR